MDVRKAEWETRPGLSLVSGGSLPQYHKLHHYQANDQLSELRYHETWDSHGGLIFSPVLFATPETIGNNVFVHDPRLAHALLTPSPLGLIIAILLAISIPILLHSFVFRTSGLVTLPSIALIGPSGAGKTSLLTLFERGANASTHTSQTPIAVQCHLPVGTLAKSNEYRSVNDLSNQVQKKFLLVDTPGHGKLRHYALKNITNPQNLKGLIFVVDAAALSAGDDGLRQTADYLHDVLLVLQKTVGTKAANVSKEIPVLIAANKMDLFTALPVGLVKSSLEGEITKVRQSRSKGLLDSGISMDDADDEKDDWLGEMGSTDFKFSQMGELDIVIEISGGNVLGDGPSVDKWWKWISERL